VGYVLGIDLGTSRTAAAIMRGDRVDVVPLSDHAATMPSMVFVRTDGSLVLGDAARRRGHEDPVRLAREFKRRFGDTTPLVLGDASLTAEQLTASLLTHVVNHVSAREGGLPDRVVVAHPANWGTYRRELLRREVAKAGLPPAMLVSEPDAAAIHYAASERMNVGDVIGVYDLGGGTFDAAVLRRTERGFVQAGEPKGIERLGGVDFDEAVFQYVQAQAGLDADEATPEDLAAYLRLRDDCQSAKEALSDDDDAVVPVMVGSVNTRVRITRQQFESMIKSSIRETVQCLRIAIIDSGLQASDLSAVLLVGGSARIPLAATMIRTELELPVVLTSNPKECVAMGAARIGATATEADFAADDAPPTRVLPLTAAAAASAVAVAAGAAPTPAAAAATASEPVAAPMESSGPHTGAVPFVPAPAAAPSRKKWPLLAGVAAVVVIGGGIAAAAAMSGGSDSTTAATTTITASSSTSAGDSSTTAAVTSTAVESSTSVEATTTAAPTTTTAATTTAATVDAATTAVATVAPVATPAPTLAPTGGGTATTTKTTTKQTTNTTPTAAPTLTAAPATTTTAPAATLPPATNPTTTKAKVHPLGDANRDCVVNQADIDIIQSDFGTSNARSDLNGDRIVDNTDLSIAQGHLGQTC
jgi:actin-like ATPase involved in cell morphogenesis